MQDRKKRPNYKLFMLRFVKTHKTIIWDHKSFSLALLKQNSIIKINKLRIYQDKSIEKVVLK